MLEKLEETSEMIINKHKTNGGTLVWHKMTFNKVTNTTAAKQYLIELGLLKGVDSLSRTTSLTPAGYQFEGFSKERQKPRPEAEKLNLELFALRNAVFDYGKIKTKADWAIWISAIAAIGTILCAIAEFSNNK